ncbi:profilin-2-like [Sparus aurata]|uniref:profilin-2-like n=1 Tax=Sparus aurata TaxID=8175 RepID=UPI0011C0D071|nr:profilin-2-like [Sparus aurata]
MSWDQWTTNMLENKEVAEAAICGKEGGIWSASDMFKGITPDEIKALYAGTEGPGNGSIVNLAGIKAMVLKTEESNGNKVITLVTMKNTVMSESSPLVIGFFKTGLVIGLGKPGFRSVGVTVESTTSQLKNRGL